MPTYRFKDNETGEVTEHNLRISEFDQFKKDNPHLSTVIQSSGIVSGTGDIKMDNGFKEVLHKVSEAHPNSELAKKVGGRSATDIKTEKVTDKLFRDHKGKITKDNKW